MLVNIIGRRRQLGIRKNWIIATNSLPTKAEPAVNWAVQNRSDQDSVRITMHHSLDGGMDLIAYGVVPLVNGWLELAATWDKLASNRVIWIGTVDKVRHR